MAVYSYKHSSLIDNVTTEKTAGGLRYAYLHASANADADKLHALSVLMEDKGWRVSPTIHNDQPALEVRKFGGDGTLIDFLSRNKFINGETHPTKDKKHKFSEWLKHNKMRLSGIVYEVADIFINIYGFVDDKRHAKLTKALGEHNIRPEGTQHWENRAMSIGYAVETAASAILGGDPSEEILADTTKKVGVYFKETFGDIPKHSSLSKALKQEKERSVISRAAGEARKDPIWVTSLFIIPGFFIALYGYRHEKGWHKAAEMTIGISTTLSAIAPWVMRHFNNKKPHSQQEVETTPDTEHASPQKPSRFRAWLQRNEFGLTGILLGFSTIVHAVLTGDKIRLNMRDRKSPEIRAQEIINQQAAANRLANADPTLPANQLPQSSDITGIIRADGNTALVANSARITFVGLNLVSEYCIGTSETSESLAKQGLDENLKHSIVSRAANALFHANLATSSEAVTKIAQFLATPDVVGGDAKALEHALHQQLSHYAAHPWIKKNGVPDNTPARENTATPANAVWQNKVLAQPAAAAQLSF